MEATEKNTPCRIKDFLSGFKLESFTNIDTVDAYRAEASQYDYTDQTFKNFRYPFYNCTSMLPAKIMSAECIVTLPIKIVTGIRTLTINSTKSTTANRIIEKVFKIVHSDVKQFERLVLKVKSLEEYIQKDELIWQSEYAKNQIRKHQPIELDLLIAGSERPLSTAGENLAKLYPSLFDKSALAKTPKDSDFGPETWNGKCFNALDFIPFELLSCRYSLKILGIDNSELLTESKSRLQWGSFVYLKTFLYYGNWIEVNSILKTYSIVAKKNSLLYWGNELNALNNLFTFNQLPRSTKIAFLLCQNKGVNTKEVLAWAVAPLIDENGALSVGRKTIALRIIQSDSPLEQFNFSVVPDGFCCSKTLPRTDRVLLTVEFPTFILPVFAARVLCLSGEKDDYLTKPVAAPAGIREPQITRSGSEKMLVFNKERVRESYPQDKKDTIWAKRGYYQKDFDMLPIMMQSIAWKNPAHVLELRRMLKQWAKPKNFRDALCLLDFFNHDTFIRDYAVDLISNLNDDELRLYILQIVQIIKLEVYNTSRVSRLMIERAIKNPLGLGHYFFWGIRTEMDNPYSTLRFYCIMEEFLYKVGDFALFLMDQQIIVNELKNSAEQTFELDKDSNYKLFLKILNQLNHKINTDLGGRSFQLMLDPRKMCHEAKVDKCRFMDSKKKPLWMVFSSKTESDVLNSCIFKRGDDLRQDALTLQLLKIMDQIWLSNDLDLGVIPYKVISTGDNLGMIEIVTDAETISKIHIKHGGGALGALKTKTIDYFLRKSNPNKADYEKARLNFVASSAGYCVATYVLGVADRHSSNIMLRRDGTLFHIDFGHFLGHFKTKMGVLRERSPFVFTPEMAYVMGGKKFQGHHLYEKFKALCNKAFCLLRENYKLFVDLLHLMIPAGMPELMAKKNIEYFTKSLMLNKTDEAATAALQKAIQDALGTTSRQLDNLIHNIKHGK